MPGASWLAPHRGGTVLTLGILSLVLCQLCGPFAWSMGARDLRLMQHGQMDPAGRSTTQAGMVCGIIGTCLLLFWVLLLFLQFAVGLAIFGAAAAGAGGGAPAPAGP
jgi:ABC-type phosphate transport system permease subunit